MTIYIILLVCSLLLSFLCGFSLSFKKGQSKSILSGKNIYLFVMFILMTLVMSLRSVNVGIDTPAYTRIFAVIYNQPSFFAAINKATISAPLYIFLCRILCRFSSDPYILITFSSIFINFFLILYIKRTSDNYPLSIFLWFGLALFYFSMNGTRQTMSIVLVLNSIYYLCKDIKSVKGWIYYIVAIFIHYASLFALLAIILLMLTRKVKSKMSVISISTIFSFIVIASTSLLKYISRFFPKYAQYVDGSSYYSILGGNGQGRIIILYLFLGVINLFYILLYLNGQKNENSELTNSTYNDAILPILIFGIIFGIANFKNELISRLLLFYLSFYISFVPNIGNGYKIDSKFKFLVKACFILVIGIYGILSLVGNQNGVVPYTFFFGW